ncbi:MAG TPA: YfhO family protein [Ktedonobacteraceae bacterium]|nr:YfhO family protein [Ktedonobacteraceae bacterium]
MSYTQKIKRRFWKTSVAQWLSPASQLVILILVALMTLWPAPFTENQLFAAWSSSDLVFSQWPFALLIQRTFAQTRQLPFWNPYFGGGQPVGADPLAALFYPPTLLVHFFSLRNYFLLLILAHLVFAGLGTLLLARRSLKLPALPALVAAVSFMATPRLISHLGGGHVTIVQTVAWYPWLALTCWATVHKPRRWGAWLGICIGMTLLAGHPQMAYYGLLMTAGLAIWLLVKQWKAEGRRSLFAPLVGLLAASTLGILLAAVHLLPLMQLTSHSTRETALSSGDAIPPLNFLRALFILPSQLGSPWEVMITPGLIVLALAFFAGMTRWRKVWPLLLGILLVALLAMGNASPLYLVVARILPDLDLFRGLARIWFIALLLIALLAGIGTDSLLRYLKSISLRGKLAANLRAASPVITGLLIVLLVACSLTITDNHYSRTGDVNAVMAPSALAITATRLAGSGRIYDEQSNISQANAVQLQARLASGWDPLLLENYVQYMQQAGGYSHTGYTLHIPYDAPSVQPDATLLGWMNVSVVLSRRPMTDPHLVQVEEIDGTLIYKNTADAGPAYLVAPGFDGKLPAFSQMQRLNTTVRVLTLAPEQEAFTFSSNTNAYFVVATPAFPGWSPTLDGRPVQVQLIAGVLPAIKVGPGVHTFRYTYTPTYLYLGTLLSALGLLAALIWLIAGYCFTRRLRVDCPNSAQDAPLHKEKSTQLA